jgi:endoglucanase
MLFVLTVLPNSSWLRVLVSKPHHRRSVLLTDRCDLAWTGAWTWTSSGNAAAFAALTDPMNNVAIQMHQYLDSDGSGTSDQCVSSTIGAERLKDATQWLKANNKKGFLGEIGAGSNSVCISAVKSALCTMQTAGGVWLGASWWAAGPWWDTVRFFFFFPL